MLVYFDTSSYNWLYKEPTKELLIEKINNKVTIIASIFNFIELASNPNIPQRIDLLNFFHSLIKKYPLLGTPSELLLNSYCSYLQKTKFYNKITKHNYLLDNFITAPQNIDFETFKIIKSIKDFEIKSYIKMHNTGRKFLQDAIKKDRAESIINNNFILLLKDFCKNNAFLGKIAQIFLKTNYTIFHNIENSHKLIKNIEPWRLYFSAMAYGLFMHSILKDKSTKKLDPGSIDIQQTIYLSTCDCFVTNDKKQKEMLILLSRINKNTLHKKIMLYKEFKEYILTEDN